MRSCLRVLRQLLPAQRKLSRLTEAAASPMAARSPSGVRLPTPRLQPQTRRPRLVVMDADAVVAAVTPLKVAATSRPQSSTVSRILELLAPKCA